MPWRLWPWWTTTRWKTQVGVRPAGCDPAGLWQMVFMPLIVVLFFQLDLTRTPSNCVSPPFNTPTNNAHASRRGNMSPSFPMFIVSYTTTVCDWPGGRLYYFFFFPQVKMLWNEISLSSTNSSYLIIILTLYVLKIVHLCPRCGLVSAPTLILSFYFSYYAYIVARQVRRHIWKWFYAQEMQWHSTTWFCNRLLLGFFFIIHFLIWLLFLFIISASVCLSCRWTVFLKENKK